MGSTLDFFPIITILSVGGGLYWLLNKFKPCTFRKTEYFNIFLLIGSFFLVIPLTWIGIQPNGVLNFSLWNYSIDLFDFGGWCFFYLVLGLIIAIIAGYFFLRKTLKNLEHFSPDLTIIKDYRILLIGFLLLDYFVLELILPLRGFDALYYYFPEAEVFSRAGRITEFNYLSFLPVVKSPLQVLLFVYSIYATDNYSFHLIPFLFLLGLVLLNYDFSLELFNNKAIAYSAAIFTLVLPFIYWMMNYWAFYQDLYLCYFFSLTCYFSLKWYKSPANSNLGLYISMGVILSLFTKITGWILPIILILWLPTELRGRIIRLGILIILGLFLSFQAATRIFIGVSLPIFISFLLAAYLILKEKSSSPSTRKITQFIPIALGVLFGSFWLINRISLSKSVWDEIYQQFLQITFTLKWVYPQQPQEPLLHTLETVHRVNFISAAAILFLGTCFVLPWIILKLYALKDYSSIIAPLIWILIFFAVWSGYYLNSSIRYLAPIVTPIILCTSWGFFQLTRKIKSKAKQQFLEILFYFLGCLNFYYLIPLESLIISNQTQEYIGRVYNQAALSYYSHPEILVIQAVGFTLLILIFVNSDLVKTQWVHAFLDKVSNLMKGFKLRWIQAVFLFVIIIIPILVQSYLLLYTQGDFAEFHAIHEYEYRKEYQDIIIVLQQQNQPLTAILTVRTPGFQFFAKQPVIDIYYQRDLFLGNPFFTNNNLTEIVDILRNPLNYTIQTDFELDITVPIKFIVVPASANLYYNIYNNDIKVGSILFQSLDVNNTIFNRLYNNSDFDLYEVLF